MKETISFSMSPSKYEGKIDVFVSLFGVLSFEPFGLKVHKDLASLFDKEFYQTMLQQYNIEIMHGDTDIFTAVTEQLDTYGIDYHITLRKHPRYNMSVILLTECKQPVWELSINDLQIVTHDHWAAEFFRGRFHFEYPNALYCIEENVKKELNKEELVIVSQRLADIIKYKEYEIDDRVYELRNNLANKLLKEGLFSSANKLLFV